MRNRKIDELWDDVIWHESRGNGEMADRARRAIDRWTEALRQAPVIEHEHVSVRSSVWGAYCPICGEATE